MSHGTRFNAPPRTLSCLEVFLLWGIGFDIWGYVGFSLDCLTEYLFFFILSRTGRNNSNKFANVWIERMWGKMWGKKNKKASTR
jgi:hypothetical protein